MPDIGIPREKPCGECHLKPGETCDICGAKEPPEPASTADEQEYFGPIEPAND